jgi:spore germination cell wall hydrolase CwlJ-like protein
MPVAAPVGPAREATPAPVEAPIVVASLDLPAARSMEDEPVAVSAPLIFEAPVPDKIPPLTGLPEMAPSAAVPAGSAAAAPEADSATVALPKPDELSANVWAHLLNPKPQLTPAQLLDLHDKTYDKAETCLAQAVYFEARDQPTKGQEAVAQVVLNRVFSPYYPKDVCSVVYQNAHHYLGCQFTFACDGKPEAIHEHGAWVRANRVARAMLAAKVWLPDVAKATHYHAAYVRPYWIREMKVMVRYGIHTFYRPRNWGDGSGEPSWGPAKKSVKS